MKLAAKWGFNQIPENAVANLRRLHFATRIDLGRQYGNQDLLKSAFEELVTSTTAIDAATRQSPGFDTYASLVDMRETLWAYRVRHAQSSARSKKASRSSHDSTLLSLVQAKFMALVAQQIEGFHDSTILEPVQGITGVTLSIVCLHLP